MDDVIEYEEEKPDGSKSGKCVVYSISVFVSEKVSRIVNLYFPDETHTNYSYSKEGITQAEIAEINLMRPEERWNEWFVRKINSFGSSWKNMLDKTLVKSTSREIEIAKKSRRSALMRKDSRAAINSIKSDIEKAKREYAETKSRRDAMRDYLRGNFFAAIAPKNLTGWGREEWVMLQTQRLKQMINLAERDMRTNRAFRTERRDALNKLKNRLSKKYESVAIKNIRESLTSKVAQMEEDQDAMLNVVFLGDERAYAKAKRENTELLEILDNPFSVGISYLTAIRRGAAEIRDELELMILGAKAPDIADSTKKHRKERHHPTSPPLNETGEFAKSLKWEVL